MSNIDAINPAPGAMRAPSAAASVSAHKSNPWFNVLAAVVIVAGIIYTAIHLANDLAVVRDTRAYPYVLLGIALLIALGFEFVNGFHDTANAVATVIYTNSMSPNLAVVWSGFFNFAGVLVSSGAVAFGIVSLLPVELILQVGSGAGFAMVFALLTAAILWNLGTWYFGLPSSSSHTLIGSIIGVGLMNQLMATDPSGTSGVDWAQAIKIGQTLLVSPLIGFSAAWLLLTILKATVKIPALYKEPEGNKPPPPWIRGLLILTCSGVSFFTAATMAKRHGPHHADPHRHRADGLCPESHHARERRQSIRCRLRSSAQRVFALRRGRAAGRPERRASRGNECRAHACCHGTGMAAMATLSDSISDQVKRYGSMDKVPPESMVNIRNEMYLVSEGLRFLAKDKTLNISAEDKSTLAPTRNSSTRRPSSFRPG